MRQPQTILILKKPKVKQEEFLSNNKQNLGDT